MEIKYFNFPKCKLNLYRCYIFPLRSISIIYFSRTGMGPTSSNNVSARGFYALKKRLRRTLKKWKNLGKYFSSIIISGIGQRDRNIPATRKTPLHNIAVVVILPVRIILLSAIKTIIIYNGDLRAIIIILYTYIILYGMFRSVIVILYSNAGIMWVCSTPCIP